MHLVVAGLPSTEPPSLLLRGRPARPVAAARRRVPGASCSPAVQPRRAGAADVRLRRRRGARCLPCLGGRGRYGQLGRVERHREANTMGVSNVDLLVRALRCRLTGHLSCATGAARRIRRWQAGIVAPATSARGACRRHTTTQVAKGEGLGNGAPQWRRLPGFVSAPCRLGAPLGASLGAVAHAPACRPAVARTAEGAEARAPC